MKEGSGFRVWVSAFIVIMMMSFCVAYCQERKETQTTEIKILSAEPGSEEKISAATATAPVPYPSESAESAATTETTEATPLPSVLKVQNDIVYFEVNPGPTETGRFSIESVRGDPATESDDNKILIYGRPRPWTSFTTVRVDGVDYVFGGTTRKRSGRSAKYGEVIEQPHVEGTNAVVTKFRIAGLEVTQRLEIAGGLESGLLDSVKITYGIRNTDDKQHRVGLRIMLDTLLGTNDGAPFKVGENNITTETRLAGDGIVDYWVAFDSLENPGVVARGTLKGEGLTRPDEVIFANWGKFADNVFDAPFAEGQSFTREGEEEMDSAIALYWNESEIHPGAEHRFVTMYGIDYLHVVGDTLTLGANPYLGKWSTAKNQIRPRTLYAYVGNLSDFEFKDVKVSLELPDGVSLVRGESATREIGVLASGEERTVGWRIVPVAFRGGDQKIRIEARSAEVESVKMDTVVTLLSPPGIEAKVEAPEAMTVIEGKRYGPSNPFEIRLVCRNRGESPIDNLTVRLVLPDGLVLPIVHRPVQSFGRLEGYEAIVFAWKVIATGDKSGKLHYSVLITSDSTEPEIVERTLEVPAMPTKIEWLGVPKAATPKVIFPAEIFINSVRGLKGAEFSVEFNPDVLQVIRVSQGTVFVESGTTLGWEEPQIDNTAGKVSGIAGVRGGSVFSGSGSLAIVHFATRGEGRSQLAVSGLNMSGADGKAVEYILENAVIEVKK
ncbi:MAG: hypothetical protein AB1546_03600 [bacterium]